MMSATNGIHLAGDFSGIQRFVLRVKTAGKAQAKRLRARSFLLELLEHAALHSIAERFQVSDDGVITRGGGGFLVRLPEGTDPTQIERLESDLQRMLWDEFGGEVQFALGWGATPAAARTAVERRKRQPGRSVLQQNGTWCAERLARPSLGIPCQVCGEFPGRWDVHEADENRDVRHCDTCYKAREIGADLTRKKWLLTGQGSLRVLGVAFDLLDEHRSGSQRVGRWIPRSRNDNAPLTFQDLARRSRGDRRIAVLKADVDDMGVRIGEIAARDPSCRQLRSFSHTLHQFFVEDMQEVVAQQWPLIYTLYAGGDDLLLVAPWQIMLDFAGDLAQRLQQGPAGEYGPLTLSAGITLSPYRIPIRHAVEQAELLLDVAKRQPGKSRCAALGSHWTWERHAHVIGSGKRIVDAVDSRGISRGLLHRLLQLAESGDGRERQLRTARWAYQVDRNVPSVRRGEPPATGDFRRWACDVTKYLDEDPERVSEAAVSLRYALLATRRTTGGRDE